MGSRQIGSIISPRTIVSKSVAHLNDEPVDALRIHAFMKAEDVFGESRSRRST
jgi:hypothetical protein